ncbi:MAG: substrate-binding domain-containing protein [Polyangiaceae bacterium]|nr:substrate-binding domain-containing protein [Polyangiaceae bacterium]
MDRRPTYGFFVNCLEEEYQNKVLSGVEETARKHGVNILCFAGGEIGSPTRNGARRNFLYDLVGPHNVDGLMVLGGTMANYAGLEHLARFCERFHPLPMVHVGVEVGGVPSVIVDNARGMHALVTHLVHVHGFRRVAFIRGPAGSPEAESRFAAYRQVLEEHGVALDPALLFEGDFQVDSGAAAVTAFLDERGVAFEAIVAASDGMAMGAIDALQAHGVRVPYDVAVVGFDDIESARFATAPLTTVRQPLYELGVHAVEYLLAQTRREVVPPRTVLRTQLITRQSCGCSPVTSIPLAQIQLITPAESLIATFQYHRQRIVSDMGQAMRAMAGSLESAWGERLLEALAAELDGQHPGVFLSTLEEVAVTMAALGGNVSSWHGALAVLRFHSRACIQVDPERWARAEDLWHEARVLVGLVAERAQGQQRLVTERADRVLRVTAEELSTALDVDAIGRVLDVRLPQLRIKSYVLAVFEGEQRPGPTARLVGARDATGRVLAAASEPFPARNLVPHPGMLPERRNTYVLQPIYYDREALGYVMLEMGPPEGVLYETIRDHVSGALKGASIFQRAVEDEGASHGGARLRVGGPRDLRAPALRAAATLWPAPIGPRDHWEFYPDDRGCWIVIGRIAGEALHVDRGYSLLEGSLATALLATSGPTPVGVLQAVNAVLHERLNRQFSATPDVRLLVVRYDATGVVRLAGSEAWLIVLNAASSRTRVAGGIGPRLGAGPDLHGEVTEVEIGLEDGDLLLLTTAAGATAGGFGSRQGIDRLASHLVKARFETVDHVRDHLLGVARAEQGAEQGDITLLAARHGNSEDTIALDEATSPGH